MLGAIWWAVSVASVAGSKNTLPDRISRSICSTAWRAWSLVRLRSVCFTDAPSAVNSTEYTMPRTTTRIEHVAASSATVIPTAVRWRARSARRRLIVRLHGGGAQVDVDGEVGVDDRLPGRRVDVVDAVGDVADHGGLGRGNRGGAGAGAAARVRQGQGAGMQQRRRRATGGAARRDR